MLRRAGDIGLWAGLYAAAAYICVAQLSGLWNTGVDGVVDPLRAAFAALSLLLTTTGAYALDRVKLRDEWIDPADVRSRPRRYSFLIAHASQVRVLSVLLFVAGMATGLAVSPCAPIAGFCAFAGVAIYAPHPRAARPRIKDLLWLKNAYVALGMTGFVTFAVLASIAPRDAGPAVWLATIQSHAPSLACACVLLCARAWLDAAVSDIDDEAADRTTGTGTLPTSIGRERTWNLTAVLRIVLICSILLCTPCPWPARAAWATAGTIGLIVVRTLRPQSLSDAVDLRFICEAFFATLMAAYLR